jgi:TIGR04076 family protein
MPGEKRIVKLTVTESRCRCGYHKKGDTFFVEDLCPPICHELWNAVYPYLFALENGAELDHGSARLAEFDARCPDGGRVVVHGEIADPPEKCKTD